MPPKTIKTLFLTGANNHDWRRTAPAIEAILEEGGRFNVIVTENPSDALADPAALQKYDLAVIDYNGPLWSDAAKSNFELAVHGGMGVCVIHAASNAFEGWTEYEKMVGLLWRKGAKSKKKSGVSAFHKFGVRIIDDQHPITAGMCDFTTSDELYHDLVHMFNTPFEVIATAYSDPEKGGSGKDEPVMIVTEYGEGKIFHTVLGHVWPVGGSATDDGSEVGGKVGGKVRGKMRGKVGGKVGGEVGGEVRGEVEGEVRGEVEGREITSGQTMIALENEGFVAGLRRGCEWAAGSKVTCAVNKPEPKSEPESESEPEPESGPESEPEPESGAEASIQADQVESAKEATQAPAEAPTVAPAEEAK